MGWKVSQIPLGIICTHFGSILNGWNMTFWKFEILGKCPGPLFSNCRKTWGLKIPDLGTTLQLQISSFSHPHVFEHKWEDGS